MGNIVRRAHLIGMPVIDGKSGKKIGEISDIIFVNQQEIVEGLVVVLDHWIKRESVILQRNLATIGEYSVIAHGYISNIILGKAIIWGRDLIGVKLVREDGYEIGKVSDIFLNGTDWLINGYEFSAGVIDDLISGRGFLPYAIPYNMDNNVLVVANSQYDNIDYCGNSGIKNIFLNKIK